MRAAVVLPALMPRGELLVLAQPMQHLAAVGAQRDRVYWSDSRRAPRSCAAAAPRPAACPAAAAARAAARLTAVLPPRVARSR